jgi:hypothetical protein
MKSAAAWQLSWALLCVLAVYLLASSTKRPIAIGALLVLIPFQFITTRYASSSVLMAYALAAILLISGGLKVRMLPELALIMLAYVASLALAGGELLTWQIVTLFQLFSCMVVFLLAYNFSRSVENERSVMNVLLATNALTLTYCVLQLSAGPGERFVPFGIEAFAFNSNRDASDPRLIGPFGTPGNTAGYLTLMIILCFAELTKSSGRRRLLVQVIAGLNLVALIATGNRAGFLILVATFPVLLIVFRRELGVRRVLQYGVGGVAVMAVALAVAVTYTDFGTMLNRLETVTETEDGVPQTRAYTWPIAVEKIKRDLWFGEGPYWLTQEDAENMGIMRGRIDESGRTVTAYDPYPHSLYLYLLRTVGVVGLAAMLWFFVRAWGLLYASLRRCPLDSYRSAILRAGLVLLPAFMGAQITLEFLRATSMDYAQFVFSLVGLLVGIGDRSSRKTVAGGNPPFAAMPRVH